MGGTNRDPFAWGRYVAVAGAYAACYELTRYFSFSHWTLTAGLRLACLLMAPKRYWPALAVGEALPIAEMAILHASLYGTLWAILASIPPILVCMPAVAWLRSRTTLLRPNGQINMGMIMLATLVCAMVTATDNSLVLATVVMDDGSPAPSPTLPIFLAWALGSYLGALTLTPTIVALRERLAAQPGGVVAWRAVWRSSLTRDALLIVIPSLALLMIAASQATDGALQCARIAMSVPVVVLTWRHGWHGAAIGGMLASIAMASTSFQLQNPAMIQAQVVLAFVISTSLLFGIRVARRMAATHLEAMARPGHR
ncbi:glucose-6-phosphate-specific signal transduction histidine kinase [Luteibacter jiangsuensis]|uniref:Glucose-6-phosphate-specific signal transduction histidine kinase n=1 Tax=Luteibacter jiangsuensis TaxID=637577 RepID=A0ABT9T133_9GAMM|nr:MASE1 domain-containing protein [Luteibacter jiangsuensis]MDQ0010985.1 glucose-6-phosphate-specific signal transduction histidine kinase [Luteibacter jiangsuensis]